MQTLPEKRVRSGSGAPETSGSGQATQNYIFIWKYIVLHIVTVYMISVVWLFLEHAIQSFVSERTRLLVSSLSLTERDRKIRLFLTNECELLLLITPLITLLLLLIGYLSSFSHVVLTFAPLSIPSHLKDRALASWMWKNEDKMFSCWLITA